MSKNKENNYVNRKDVNIPQEEVYELNFERFVDFMTLMIEKYGAVKKQPKKIRDS